MVYTDGTHLTADTLEELHKFALGINLKRKWFQNHPEHPHYDLTTHWSYVRAVKAGATNKTSKEILRISKKLGEE